MNIFEQYGIKEVADVTIYSIHKKEDGSGDLYYVPALYLDTLKVSSTAKTAENTWARGGLGNSQLICWDYGKTINVTLEDALCTPASLGLCWGGVLSSDWKNGKIEQEFGISFKETPEKISRMEKCFYPKADRKSVSYLLPHTEEDIIDANLDILLNSRIVDGTKVSGFGAVNNHTYKWNMIIESNIQSISVVPDRFFDVNDKSYPIDVTHQVVVNSTLGTNKFNIIYRINSTDSTITPPTGSLIIDKSLSTSSSSSSASEETATVDGHIVNYDKNSATFNPPSSSATAIALDTAKYLCITITNDDEYVAYVSANGTSWAPSATKINVNQFKYIDMWLRFSSVNELVYYIITKYNENVCSIGSAKIETKTNDIEVTELDSNNSSLWAYVNPKTMTPYPDDYWFNQGEVYYKKSLTLSTGDKKIKAKQIRITAGQFPGMYMLVGETYIRNRDTGEDERMQLKFPMCKIKSDQTLTLQADGDPTVFNLEIELAKPKNDILMEITAYEVDKSTQNGEIKDGSTDVVVE